MIKTQLVAGHINSKIEVLSPEQGFELCAPLTRFKLGNRFLATAALFAINDFDFSNVNLAGYKFRQTTSYGTPTKGGTFSLNYFEQDGRVVQRLFNVTSDGIVFDLQPSYNGSVLANKDYIDASRNNITLSGDISGAINSSGNITTTLTKPVVSSLTAGNNIVINTSTGNVTIGLSSSGVTAGAYLYPTTIVTNAYGIVTGINAGVQPITGIIAGTGLTAQNSNGSAIVSLNNTGVTAGNYTNPNITVNGQGQLTFVASGTQPITAINTLGNISASQSNGTVTLISNTPIIDINNGTSGQLNTARLQNFPNNSSLFLNGAGNWASPATGLPMQLAYGSLSSSQILNMMYNNTPVQVISAQGAGIGIVVIHLIINFIGGSALYSNGGGIGLFANPKGAAANLTTYIDAGMLRLGGNSVSVATALYQQSQTFAASANLINTPVHIANIGSSFTGGNGVLAYQITYYALPMF